MQEQPTPRDQELVEAVRKGNLASFDTLVHRYQGIVHRFLFHFMRHSQDAEDVTQETFVTFYRKLDLYKPEHALKSWLLTMARNLAISHHRRRTAAPVDPEILADLVRDVASGPEHEVVLRERVREVQDALGRLPDEMREVLVMRYMLDFPIQKVAEVLNIPEGTAKSRAFQARAALKESLRCLAVAEDRET
jgi:RNA polymerase sigma-70 factor, ECF subfamily